MSGGNYNINGLSSIERKLIFSRHAKLRMKERNIPFPLPQTLKPLKTSEIKSIKLSVKTSADNVLWKDGSFLFICRQLKPAKYLVITAYNYLDEWKK